MAETLPAMKDQMEICVLVNVGSPVKLSFRSHF